MDMAQQPKRTRAQQGAHAVRHITKAVAESKTNELEHLRFRDADKSVKGGAMLAFSGLMMAADLVFLSAGEGAFIPSNSPYAWGGFWALALLLGGAFFATWSIMEPGGISHREYPDTDEFIAAVSEYHERREKFLKWSIRLTGLGTFVFMAALALSVIISPPS